MHVEASVTVSPYPPPDMLSPNVDQEVPMEYTSDFGDSEKISLIDDPDDACSIPGSFSPNTFQDNSQGETNEDQRCALPSVSLIFSFSPES